MTTAGHGTRSSCRSTPTPGTICRSSRASARRQPCTRSTVARWSCCTGRDTRLASDRPRVGGRPATDRSPATAPATACRSGGSELPGQRPSSSARCRSSRHRRCKRLRPADDPCHGTLVTWDEIGVPQETVDSAFDRKPREFRVIDDEVTEVPVPADVRGNVFANAGLRSAVHDRGRHAGTGWDRTGCWSRARPRGHGGYLIGSQRRHEFVQIARTGACSANSTGIGASRTMDEWTYTDWSELVGRRTRSAYAQQAA